MVAWFDDLMVLPFSGVLMCTDVMARGVDFPAVDWVIQFDPPSSARYVGVAVGVVCGVCTFLCTVCGCGCAPSSARCVCVCGCAPSSARYVGVAVHLPLHDMGVWVCAPAYLLACERIYLVKVNVCVCVGGCGVCMRNMNALDVYSSVRVHVYICVAFGM